MGNSEVYIVIPARYGSTRFPGKPLKLIGGKTMIQRVYERALLVEGVKEIIVATDDDRIFSSMLSAGAKTVLTRLEHLSGTSRCAEATAGLPGDSIVVNLQGDEPFINPEAVNKLIHLMQSTTADIATLITEVGDEASDNPNRVKVSIDSEGRALGFSRADLKTLINHESKYYQHIGIYAYRKKILSDIVKLPVAEPEINESLEQLRWTYHGYTIWTSLVDEIPLSIDTPDDLIEAENFLKTIS